MSLNRFSSNHEVQNPLAAAVANEDDNESNNDDDDDELIQLMNE